MKSTPSLLETRRLLLVSSGFRAHSVPNLEQFQSEVDEEDSDWNLFILCHTIPKEERDRIYEIAIRAGAGLYQLERMEAPPRFIHKVSRMLDPAREGRGSDAES